MSGYGSAHSPHCFCQTNGLTITTPREAEIDTWDQVARAWRTWWSVIEAGVGCLGRRLVERAGGTTGARILDIGTGIGEPALTAAAVAGPTGCVVGLDRAAAMLALADERAGEATDVASRARVAFVHADAAALPFSAHSFDAGVCRFGLMHVPEPDTALLEARRALRPGARFATAVWGLPAEVPFLSASRDAVVRELNLPTEDPDGGPFCMHDAAQLIERFERAGFVDAQQFDQTVELAFASASEYARFVFDISGWTRRASAGLNPTDLQRVRTAIEAAASQHARPDGTIRFVNRASTVDARA